MKRIRRTYLILSPVWYDETQKQWVRTPHLVQRLEHREDAPGYYLRRELGASVALVESTTYPALLEFMREQR